MNAIDISQYGKATQARIIAATEDEALHAAVRTFAPSAPFGYQVHTRAVALAQSVREAEDRAAVKYSATLRNDHSAWSCTDRQCERHPASLYGR